MICRRLDFQTKSDLIHLFWVDQSGTIEYYLSIVEVGERPVVVSSAENPIIVKKLICDNR